MILKSSSSKSRSPFVSWFSVVGGPTVRTCTSGFADTCDPGDSSNSSNAYRQILKVRLSECGIFHKTRLGSPSDEPWRGYHSRVHKRSSRTPGKVTESNFLAEYCSGKETSAKFRPETP